MFDDDTIRTAYMQLRFPADRILCDPVLSAKFAERVAEMEGVKFNEEFIAPINKKLLTLRKRGADNGGLPRLQREYHGRN